MRRLIWLGVLVVIHFQAAHAAEFSLLPVELWPITGDEGMVLKTLGGRQFWGDVHLFHGWRIQQNVFTGHYRLLDAADNRHDWGSLETCQKTLEAIRVRDKLPAMKGRAIIMVHGILRSSTCMSALSCAVQKAGFQPFEFDYPSTQVSIPEAADYLDRAIRSLEGIEEINIVAHSMGGLVTRAYFADHADPRIKRVVMLGTPNHGAELADLLHRSLLVWAASGPGGRQLVTDPHGLIPNLPIPKCEFALIAGARGQAAGWNPFIPGDDDGTVTVESTRLEGASDFSTVPTTHSALLQHPETIEQTLRYINEGRLRADRDPMPIEKPVAQAQAAVQGIGN